MGLTAEEADGIQQLAMANGMTAKDVTSTLFKQTSALAKQTGIQLDNKAIVQEVAKVSGQLRLQYKNNPKLIAKAVVETKKLGINMEIAANAAKGLLDFESSIENELSAELLGSSYKGDNVKANVNSGEMVLNGSQQKNLFDLANGKASKGNNNQDSSLSYCSYKWIKK
jgi:hypothetical protein